MANFLSPEEWDAQQNARAPARAVLSPEEWDAQQNASAPAVLSPENWLKDQQRPDFWNQAVKGGERAWEGLKYLPDEIALQLTSNTLQHNAHLLDVYDKVDSGVLTAEHLRAIPGPTPVKDRAPSMAGLYYFNSAPEKRQELRDKASAQVRQSSTSFDKGLQLYDAFIKDTQKYRGKVAEASDIGTVTDFGNWLSYNVGSGAVQMAPMIVAALLKQPSLVAGIGGAQAFQETIGVRMEHIHKEAVKKYPGDPEKQAGMIAKHLDDTGAISVRVAIASGVLDRAFGPVASILKKRFAKEAAAQTGWQTAKGVVADVAEEAVTGAAQQGAQIAGQRAAGEQTGNWATRENLLSVLNAAAAEAAGSVAGAGVSAAVTPMQSHFQRKAAAEAQEAAVREARRAATPPSSGDVNAVFGGLVAQYQSEGMSESEALRAAGRDIAAGAGNVRTTGTEQRAAGPTVGGAQPTVQPPSGESGVGTPAGAPTGTQRDGQTVREGTADQPEGRVPTFADTLAQLEERTHTFLEEDDAQDIFDLAQEYTDAGFAPVAAFTQAYETYGYDVDLTDIPEFVGGPATPSTTAPVAAPSVVPVDPQVETAEAAAPVATPTPTPTEPTAEQVVTPTEPAPAAETAPTPPLAFEEDLNERAPVRDTPVEEDPNAQAPVMDTPIAGDVDPRAPTMEAPVEEDPNARAPVMETAVDEAPDADAPVMDTPVEEGQDDIGTPPEVEINEYTGLEPTGKRRGRKPVERTQEETDARSAARRESAGASRDATRAAERAQNIFDTPFEETTAAKEAANDFALEDARQQYEAKLLDALTNAYRVQQNPAHRKNKAGKIATNVIGNPNVTARQREIAGNRAKRDPNISRADLIDGASTGEHDALLGKFKNGTEALTYIANFGNAFERLLAKRLLPFMGGVRIVIVNDPKTDIGSAVHRKKFSKALGMYVPNLSKPGGTIYLSNLAGFDGLSAMTVLHEALHGATLAKINTYIYNRDSLDAATIEAIQNLEQVMYAAYGSYSTHAVKGRSTHVLNQLFKAGAFTDLKEFVAYGLSQPEMQRFLSNISGAAARGYQRPEGLFSKFVESFRKMFNIPKDKVDLLQDLMVTTDRLLDTPYVENLPALVADDFAVMAQPVSGGNSNRQRKISALERKLQLSHMGTDLNASLGELMLKTRNVKDAVRLLRAVYKGLNVGTIRKLLPTLNTNDITSWVGDQIQNISVVNTAVQDLAGMRAKLTRELAEKIPKWAAFNAKFPKGATLLADVMNTATLLGINPSAHATAVDAIQSDHLISRLTAELADPATTPKKKVALKGQLTRRTNEIKSIYTMWDKLGAYGKGAGHEIFKTTLESYKKTFALHEKLLLEKILNSKVPGDAKDAATPKGKLISAIIKTFQDAKLLEVYFPLMRYGEFWMRVGDGKSGEFYMFESAAARNNALDVRVEDLRKAGDTRTRDEMIEQGAIDLGDNPDGMRKQVVDGSDMLKSIFEMLDQNKVGDIDALKDNIYQMYLMTLPEKDIRRRFTHRKGKTGFSSDVLRNFISAQHTAANQLSRLAYADKIRNGIASAYAELAGNPDKVRLSTFIDEIAIRASDEMTPQVSSEFNLDKLATITNQVVFYYMLTAPKSAIVQMTQLPIVGIPVLSAKYGAVDVAKTIARYSNLYDKLGTTKVDAAGNVITKWGQPTIHDSRYVNNHPDKAYKAMLQHAWMHAQDSNIFMSTFTADVTDRAAMPSSKHGGLAKRGTRAVLQLMSGAFHHSERLTREIMFMSTFELAFAQAKKGGLDDKAAYTRAVEEATEMTRESLFDYSQYNKPRIMKTGGRRIITQFMTYPLQMVSFLLRNFYGMLPYLNKEGKREAATKLFGVLGMTGLFAGVVGLPLYSLTMGLIDGVREFMRPEDDEEYDEDEEGNPLGKRSTDLWFREWFLPHYFGRGSSLAEFFNLTDEQADMLQRGVEMGPISAITDLNIGASTSLDGLMFRDHPPAKTSEDAFIQTAFRALTGPLGGMGTQIAGAFDDFNDGDFNRAVEKLLPAFFRGGAKAYRQSEEGEQTPQGDVIRDAEWHTTGKLIGQVVGFQSTTVAEIQKFNSLARRIVGDIQKDRAQILDDVYGAVMAFDRDPTDAADAKLEQVVGRIDAFNAKNPIPGFVITRDTVKSSIEGKATRNETSFEGLAPQGKAAGTIHELSERYRNQ